MLLVYNEILNRVINFTQYENVYENANAKPMIENFIQANLQGASYDMSINNHFMRIKNPYSHIKLSSESDVKNMFEEIVINDMEPFVIRPYEYVMVGVHEKINMPDDLAASIRARVSLNRVGLVISTQHINPSFSGVLQIGIKNESLCSIEIPANIKICQIVFETLSGSIEEDKLYRNKKNSVYFNSGDDFIPSKIYSETTLKAAEDLYNKISNLCGNED